MWLPALIAGVCTVALWLRLSLLMPNWKLRGRVAIGLAVGFLTGLAQSAIKHEGAAWGLLLVADGYFAVLVSMIGMGDYLRNSALKYAAGIEEEVSKKKINRMLIVLFGTGIPLIVIEALLLHHTTP